MSDPFHFTSSSPHDECFQAWVAPPGSVVESLATYAYTPVVESGNTSRVIRKHYPSPKEKGKMNFMERMGERNVNQSRLKTVVGIKSKSRGDTKKVLTMKERVNENPIDRLKCSNRMKKFISAEFEREKNLYNFLPVKQVALAVIHKYKVHLSSSGRSGMAEETYKKKKINGKSVKLGRKVKKKKPSAGDSGFLDHVETDSASEEVDIQEFDEDELPARGSFSLLSTTHLSITAQLMVRYNCDSDTDNISDSSSGKIVCSSPVREEKMMRKVALCGPVLPCLTSSSLDQPGTTSVDWDDGLTGKVPDSETGSGGHVPNLAQQVCEGQACGWCLAMPGPEKLQLCSACSSIAYCGPTCQGDSWQAHKRVCKKLKGVVWSLRMELVTTMLKLSRNMKERKTAKSVQFSSQPQFEPSQPQPAAGPSVQPRSILRRGTVILETVLYSPPIKTLEQHLVTVREGRQEDRFMQLMEGEGESSIKKQTSQKLKRRLSEIGHARLNLSKKLDGPAKSPTPSVNHQMSFATISSGQIRLTPISSPTLIQSVKTISSKRQSSGSRTKSRLYQSTPYPHLVNLESDQELSLIPSGEEEEGGKIIDDVTCKLDFVEDYSEDEWEDEIEVATMPSSDTKKNEVGELVNVNSEVPVDLPHSPEDMFASQGFDNKVMNGEEDAEETEFVDEENSATGEVVLVPESSSGSCVMVPSSSGSSLALFSPIQVQKVESQDGLMDMFSEPDQEDYVERPEDVEDDLLADIGEL